MMMRAKIPLFLGSYGNVDEIGLGAYSAALQDAYTDEADNIRKRPGLEQIVDIGTGAVCDGFYWWYKQSVAVHVSDGTITKITAAAGTNSDITGTGTPQSGKKVYFADFGAYLYAANGGKIIRIPAAGNAAYLADADAPTTVSHVAALNQKLIALDTSTSETFEWSDAGDPTSWTNTFASAQRIPDDLKALAVGNDRLWLWGTHSLELWIDDGETPFVPEYNAHWPQGGIIGPDAFVYALNTFYWINQHRKLVRLTGSQVELLPPGNSQSFSQRIQGFTTVSDVFMDYLSILGRDLIVCHFPTEDETLVYDIGNHRWYEWGDWSGSDYSRWRAQRMIFADAWNMTMTGSKTDGNVYSIDTGFYSDGTVQYYVDENGDNYVDEDGNFYIGVSNSAQIRVLLRTGEIHHDSYDAEKTSYKYVLTVRRTATIESSQFNVQMRFRDDGDTSGGTDSDGWSDFRDGSVSATGDTTFKIEWRRNGSYVTRQIEIIFADDAPLLVKPILEETLEFGE